MLSKIEFLKSLKVTFIMVVINEKLDLVASKGIVEACYSMPIFTIVVTLKKKCLKQELK